MLRKFQLIVLQKFKTQPTQEQDVDNSDPKDDGKPDIFALQTPRMPLAVSRCRRAYGNFDGKGWSIIDVIEYCQRQFLIRVPYHKKKDRKLKKKRKIFPEHWKFQL